MKQLRIGDLVYYYDSRDDGCGWKGKGLVTLVRGRDLISECVKIMERRDSIRSIIDKKWVTKVIRREDIKEWWKYL